MAYHNKQQHPLSQYHSMDDDDSDHCSDIASRKQRIRNKIRQAKEYIQKKRLPKGQLASSLQRKSDQPKRLHEQDEEDAEDKSDDETEEVYIVRQTCGIFAILFSIVQTIILGLMMWQCGIAPLNLNPMIGPYPDALNEWGGKNSVLIISDHEYWRLITPVLLHAGIIHLLGNILVQIETGAFFEKEWGSIRWLMIYIVSGVGSSVGSTIFMPTAISVGSSGAVMGLFGAKLAEVLMRMCEKIRTKQDEVASSVRKEQCCAVSVSVAIVMAFSFIPFVDWSAHTFGLLSGFVIGIMIFAFEMKTVIWKFIWFAIGTCITTFLFYYGFYIMYDTDRVELIDELRDVCAYYEQNYDNYQCNCMRNQYQFGMNNNQNNNNQNRK